MKKLFMLLALVLGVVSCQNDPEGFGVVVGGEQDVNITVSLPESTRAASSTGFDFTNFAGNTQFDLRFILEIRHDNGTEVKTVREVKTSNTTSTTFPVRLAPGREYTFTVWADLVKQGADGYTPADLFYNTTDLANITLNDVNEDFADNVELRDAYTHTDTFNFTTEREKLNMTLTRPFAKVRVVATDIADVRKFGIEPAKGIVSYSSVYSAFNAVKGDVTDNAERAAITYNIADDKYTEQAGQLTVFADYIFVPTGDNTQPTITFSLDVQETNGGSIKSTNFNTQIPVERNKVTSIVGDVLTEGGNVSITINGTLEEKETINYVDTAESLQEIINNIEDGGSANIELGGDVNLDDLLSAGLLSATRTEKQYGLQIPANKTVILDLNGKRIYQAKECTDSYSMILNNGNLTITGNGTIEFTNTATGGSSSWGTYTIENRGDAAVLTIDNATILHKGCENGEVEHDTNIAIQNYQGKVVVNEGTISSPQFRSLRDFTDGGEIIINGGTFLGQVWMQGLGNGSSSLTINGGNFSPVAGYDGSSVYITNSGNVVNVAVNGGMFNTKIGCYDATKEGAKGCITGGTFTTAAKENTAAALINDDYAWVEAENGLWNVVKAPIAQVGDVVFDTSIEDAVAAAKAGDTITLLKDITITTGLTLPADVIFNGNGKQIDGSISAGGNLTFVGHTKVTSFSASYYNRTITIGEGACLEITGTGRVTLGYGNTFNIIGSIEDAKSTDKEDIYPSLIIPGGISITGGNNATMNVTNAYVVIGSTTSKNSAANGEFTLNFNNAIAEFTAEFGFYAPTGGMDPTFVMNIEDSVFTTGAKLCVAAANSTITVNNSTVTLGSYLRNSGTIKLTNGSVLTGKTIQFGENGGNDGDITVDNSSFSINCGNSTDHAFDGKGTGSITATNSATVAVQYYKDMTINVDATSTFTGTDIYGNRKIHYVSEEMKLEPTNPDALGGATIVSNVWDKTTGKGVITFDRDLTIIGDKAFQRVTNTTPSNWATSITLPASVKSIGEYAFAQCYSLTTITIPDGVTTIGQYAFQSCDAVTTVTIGSRVSTIGSSAFYNCYEIKEFICKSATPPALADKWVFNGVEKIATVYVPAASVEAYKAAWSMFADKVVAGEF